MFKEKETIFYKEWLSLPKGQFRLLILLAYSGGFSGNLSELCRRLGLKPQNKTIKAIRKNIEELTKEEMIESVTSGRKHSLKIIPKETEIIIPSRWIDIIKIREKYCKSVAFEVVIKVLLWMLDNDDKLFRNQQVASELCISETTVGYAKKVLINDFDGLNIQVIRKQIYEGEYRCIGQIAAVNALLHSKEN